LAAGSASGGVVFSQKRMNRARVSTPIDHHGAGAALPMVAAFFRAGQMKVLAQRVEQGRACVDLQRACLTIHAEADVGKSFPAAPPVRSAKSASCSRATAGAAWAAIAVAPTVIRSRRVTLKDSALLTDESLGSIE
jgi:hypothetical protein